MISNFGNKLKPTVENPGGRKMTTREFRYFRMDLEDYPFIVDDYGTVPITWQKTNFGKRLLFICPECEKRFLTMFLIDNKWACRNCHKLKYELERVSKSWYNYTKLVKLREKYKLKIDFMPPIEFERPKGMHKKTYKKLKDDLNEINYLSWTRAYKRFSKRD